MVKQASQTKKPTRSDNQKLEKAGKTVRQEFLVDLLPSLAFKIPKEKDHYTPSEKRYLKEAAVTLLEYGYSTWETASILRLPQSTVQVWNSKLTDQEKAEIQQRIVQSVSESMSGFLNASLRAMGRIAQYCSLPEYLDKHGPAEVSKLVEVIGTKSYQLIEAQQRAQMAKLTAQSGYAPKGLDESTEADTSTDDASTDQQPLPIDIPAVENTIEPVTPTAEEAVEKEEAK